jgi:hypothetical protein
VPVHGQSLGDRQRQDVVADERAEHEGVVAAPVPQVEDSTLDVLHGPSAESGSCRRNAEPLPQSPEEFAYRAWFEEAA